MSNRKTIFIPVLVLLYFFIHYITDLWYFLDPVRSWLIFVQYFFIVALLFLTGYMLLKNRERYSLVFSTVLFLFLFFGSMFDTAVSLKMVQPVNHIDVWIIILFIAAGIVIVSVCVWIKQITVNKLLKFWMIYCLVLITYDSVVFIFSEKREKKYLAISHKIKRFEIPGKPSIFFLLFDMYPSDTVLEKYMGYDNAALAGFLKKNDFFVTGNAHSLYSETYYSLSSTLNLERLEYIDDSTIEDYKKKLIALKNIKYSLVPDLLESSGYTFRNYSIFNVEDQQSPLRFNLNYHLDNALTGSTFFNRFYNVFEADFFLASRNINLGFIKRSWSDNVKRDINFLNTNFTTIMDSFSQTKPSFNYFHFMIPHPPILYDSSGHEQSIKNMYAYNGFEQTNKNFTGYIKYANELLKKMVNEIFEKAGRNVIIIIQGDHGYREFNDRFPDAVRYGVLNAVYLPAKNYKNFNDSMTVLYTFKEIFNN